MKSDREFLDGIYRKAEKMDVSKTLSHEDISLLKNEENRKGAYFPRRAVHFAGSFAVLALVLSVSGILPQIAKQKDPGNPPRVAVRSIDLTEDHPLFGQATEIIQVKAERVSGSISLSLVETYKESGEDLLLRSFLEKNELGIQEGQEAVLFLEIKDGEVQVLDVFNWEEEMDSFINGFQEILTRELLEKVK